MQSQNVVSAEFPDWTREAPRRFWDPSRKLLRSIRQFQRQNNRNGIIGQLTKKLCVLRYRFWSVVTGADIPLTVQIGGGLIIIHPNGIVIAPNVDIGVNCLIFQQVSIGVKVKKIGGHVDIGAGAKLIGPITIGNHVNIGANAVVLNDVPDYCTAVGVPARIIEKK